MHRNVWEPLFYIGVSESGPEVYVPEVQTKQDASMLRERRGE